MSQSLKQPNTKPAAAQAAPVVCDQCGMRPPVAHRRQCSVCISMREVAAQTYRAGAPARHAAYLSALDWARRNNIAALAAKLQQEK